MAFIFRIVYTVYDMTNIYTDVYRGLTDMKINILYEDNDIIVCHKAPGVSSQAERSSDPDMVSLLMNHFHKSGVSHPYVGVVHRLDKPVAGVIIYGKNERSTKLLSEQITHHKLTKKYQAILCGDIGELVTSAGVTLSPDGTYSMTHHLLRDAKTNTSSVVDPSAPAYRANKEVKESRLSFKVLKTISIDEGHPLYKPNCPYDNKLSLVDIHLHTGRHHQIRVQFSHVGFPLWGDMKYSSYSSTLGQRRGVALCAYDLTIKHPSTGELMNFHTIPDNSIFRILEG